MLCFTEQKFLPDVLWEPEDAVSVREVRNPLDTDIMQNSDSPWRGEFLSSAELEDWCEINRRRIKTGRKPSEISTDSKNKVKIYTAVLTSARQISN